MYFVIHLYNCLCRYDTTNIIFYGHTRCRIYCRFILAYLPFCRRHNYKKNSINKYNMKNPKLLIIINLVAFIAVLVMNTLANSLPLNGHTPGQLSDMYPNLFVPAGVTFAIWGIIYSWLLVFVSMQVVALFSTSASEKVFPWVLRVGNYFAISSFLNIAWLFAWHWRLMGLSVFVMLCLLVTLLRMSIWIGVGKSKYNKQEKWLVHAPFSVYLGWISIATIANITAFLVSINWQGWGISAFNWTTTMIVIGTLIALFVIRCCCNLGFNRNKYQTRSYCRPYLNRYHSSYNGMYYPVGYYHRFSFK